jgi:hypothetical protein
MAASTSPGLKPLIGREPERLTLKERSTLAGKWMAVEIYSPETRPRKQVEALGDSVEECVRQLRDRGLDPAKFEFSVVVPAY